MQIKDYTDALGIPRRVALPDNFNGDDFSEGIPVSFDLDAVYGDLPAEFRRKLYAACWDQGLITPCDYAQPGASEKFHRALLIVIKLDFVSAILPLAREVCNHGK
jgi:hypothetical protein